MDKIKSKHRNWLISIMVNTIILVTVLLCTNMIYETNDDFVISCRLADGCDTVNFVNYFLCKGILLLQKVAPSVNVYVVLQIVLSFIAFCCIFKIIIDKKTDRYVGIILTLTILIYSVDHYSTIQFTKTAALLLVSGMMILIDSMTERRTWGYYVVAMILFITGAMFRIDGLIVSIGFGGIYLLVWIIQNRKRLIPEGFISAKKAIVYIILLLLIGSCYGLEALSYEANTGTDELKAYKAYSELRSDIVDYPVYDYYENNSVAYDDVGISENDLYLIDHWYFDYDGAASVNNLKKIVEVDRHDKRPPYTITQAFKKFVKDTIKGIRKLSFTGIHLVILVVISAWMLLSLKRGTKSYVILIGALTICLYMVIYYRQRIAYRALYVADLGATLWLLYYMSSNFTKENRTKIQLGKYMAVFVALIMAVMIIPARLDLSESYKAAEKKVMSQDMSNYLQDNKDKFYVVGSSEKKYNSSYLTPSLAADTDSDVNSVGSGSWGTMSPYVLGKLHAYGINNPIKGLIDNEAAFYVGNKNIERLESYYNKWYGSDSRHIHMENVGEVSGINIWKIVSYEY